MRTQKCTCRVAQLPDGYTFFTGRGLWPRLTITSAAGEPESRRSDLQMRSTDADEMRSTGSRVSDHSDCPHGTDAQYIWRVPSVCPLPLIAFSSLLFIWPSTSRFVPSSLQYPCSIVAVQYSRVRVRTPRKAAHTQNAHCTYEYRY